MFSASANPPFYIQALAEAIRDIAPPPAQPAVAAVALKLPAFWTSDPEVWFAQVEAQFQTRNPPITTDQTKFDYIVTSLDPAAAKEVRSIILQPPAAGSRYSALKTALIAAFGRTQESKDAELLSMTGLGDRTPTGLLRHMRSLNSNPATLFKALWLAQLPPEARRICAASPGTDLDDLAKQADAVVETSRNFNCQVVIAAARTNAQAKFPRTTELCFFHAKFGKAARKCRGEPCPMHSLPQQSGSVSSPISGNDQAGR